MSVTVNIQLSDIDITLLRLYLQCPFTVLNGLLVLLEFDVSLCPIGIEHLIVAYLVQALHKPNVQCTRTQTQLFTDQKYKIMN